MSSYLKNTWADRQAGTNVLGGIALFAILACIINSAVPLIEMMLLGGRVPTPPSVVKIICFGYLLALMLLYRSVDLSSVPMVPWAVVMIYLAAVFPYLIFGMDMQVVDVLLGYNAYYCPLILLPVLASLRGRVSERTALMILLGVFAINAGLGWAQFLSGKPIIRLESIDGAYSIPLNVFQVGGRAIYRVRAFGLFNNSMEFGYFATIIAGIGVAMWRLPQQRLAGILLYIIGIATAYSTLTRAVFLQITIATFAAIVFTFGRKATRLKWLPVGALGIGLTLAVGGVPNFLHEYRQGLANDISLQVRLDQWSFFWSMFRHASIWKQLFGFGICQADNKVIRSIAIADNLFWGLSRHIGIVGMIIVFVLMWAMWLRLRAQAVERQTPLLIGLASFWSTFAMTGMFENAPAVFGFWFSISILVSSRVWVPATESSSNFQLAPGAFGTARLPYRPEYGSSIRF